MGWWWSGLLSCDTSTSLSCNSSASDSCEKPTSVFCSDPFSCLLLFSHKSYESVDTLISIRLPINSCDSFSRCFKLTSWSVEFFSLLPSIRISSWLPFIRIWALSGSCHTLTSPCLVDKELVSLEELNVHIHISFYKIRKATRRKYNIHLPPLATLSLARLTDHTWKCMEII